MPWSHTGQTKHLGGGRARCGVLRTKQGEESSYVSPVTSVGCQSPTEGERQESLKWGVRVWVGRGVYICKGMSCQNLGGVMRLATHGRYFDVGNRAQIVKDASAWRGSQLWVSEGQRYGGDLQQCRRSSVERVPTEVSWSGEQSDSEPCEMGVDEGGGEGTAWEIRTSAVRVGTGYKQPWETGYIPGYRTN